MESLLRSHSVDVRERYEYSHFFEVHRIDALALHETGAVSVFVQTASSDDWYGLRARANQLAHDGVHALLFRSLRMPHEHAEREASTKPCILDMLARYSPETIHAYINERLEERIAMSVASDEP